jgi:hypothetical protein
MYDDDLDDDFSEGEFEDYLDDNLDDDFVDDDFSDKIDDDLDPWEDSAESFLDPMAFADEDDYADALRELEDILLSEGFDAALGYAKQFEQPDFDSIYISFGEHDFEDATMENTNIEFSYRVIYTNAPIGEDKLNELAKEGYRLVFMLSKDATSWITYMEKRRLVTELRSIDNNNQTDTDLFANLNEIPF